MPKSSVEEVAPRRRTVGSHLLMEIGHQAGSVYPLDKAQENLIGRDLDCQVLLTDALSSRVHATVVHQDDNWWIRDSGSRNGTYVNGQKIDEARLTNGTRVKVGTTVLVFHDGVEAEPTGDEEVTQTLVFDTPVDPGDSANLSLAALSDPERGKDLLVLYQLSIRLSGCGDPDEVVSVALDLLMEHTKATVGGFLWVSDDGQLKPKLVIPADAAEKVRLSHSLTELVCQKGHAVRIDHQSTKSSAQSLCRFTDAICVPLIHDKRTVGAVHLYMESGRFPESDFEFAISLANITVVALVRARQHATLEANHRRLVAKSGSFDELIGESKAMSELKSRIARVGRATGCVLLRGESGSGKELVARALHRSSLRADRPLLAVNCAAIPADLMDSQLFGHRKGAFTGADSDHAGWFQQADTGTLFLDEVGEMTLEGQARLLRILEAHPFLPVGATREISVDVRVIAATNRNLSQYVREKRFREDLYYRLTAFEIRIPPLRERGNDIELLADFFLEHFSTQHGRVGLRLTDTARHKLVSYHWPGNVRQLRNVIDSAVVLAEGHAIEPEDMGLLESSDSHLESLRLDYWERKIIQQALNRTGGRIPEAAKMLGIGRATLYRKIEEYGIER
jgi:Nif-specific regulatory protein